MAVSSSSVVSRSVKLMGLGLATILSLAACQKSETGSNQTASRPNQNQTTLRIATEGAYKPFNYTKADGSLAGFDVDIANALCADMKVNCQVVAQDWDGIIPALNAKKYDMIISAMSVTPERQLQVDFTEPYFVNSLIFLAKKDSNFNPDMTGQIEQHTIAAQRSTISSQWLEKTHPNAQSKLYDTLDNAFMDLSAGRVDAMVSDKAPALAWLNSDIGKSFVQKGSEIDIHDKLAIAVRRGDPLRERVNTALSHIRSNGTYDKIMTQHFGKATTSNATVVDSTPNSTATAQQTVGAASVAKP